MRFDFFLLVSSPHHWQFTQHSQPVFSDFCSFLAVQKRLHFLYAIAQVIAIIQLHPYRRVAKCLHGQLILRDLDQPSVQLQVGQDLAAREVPFPLPGFRCVVLSRFPRFDLQREEIISLIHLCQLPGRLQVSPKLGGKYLGFERLCPFCLILLAALTWGSLPRLQHVNLASYTLI